MSYDLEHSIDCYSETVRHTVLKKKSQEYYAYVSGRRAAWFKAPGQPHPDRTKKGHKRLATIGRSLPTAFLPLFKTGSEKLGGSVFRHFIENKLLCLNVPYFQFPPNFPYFAKKVHLLHLNCLPICPLKCHLLSQTLSRWHLTKR